jgi:hypothetical protein
MQVSKFSIIGAISALSLAGCVPASDEAMATAEASPSLTAALSGRTLTSGSTEIVLGADGSLSGMAGTAALSGTWTETNGQFCRTLTAPSRLVGTQCQDVTFNGDGTLTIDGVNGPVTYTIS